MESFTIQSELNQDDWRAYVFAAQARSLTAQRKPLVRVLVQLPVAYFAVLATWFFLAIINDWDRHLPIAALLGVCLYTWLWQLIVRMSENAADRGLFLGSSRLEFTERGMHLLREGFESNCSWDRVKEVTGTDLHLYVWLDRFTAHCIPVRDLPAGMTPAIFKERIASFIAQSPEAGAALAPATSSGDVALAAAAPDSPPAALSVQKPGVLRELAELGKLFFSSRVDDRRLVGRDLTILLLFASAIGLSIGLDRLHYGLDVDTQFMWHGMIVLPLYLFVACVTAWLFARISRPTILMARATLLVAGLSPIVALLLVGGGLLGKSGEIACWAILGGLAFHYLAYGLKALSRANQRPAFLLGVAWLVGITLAIAKIQGGPNFWYAPEAEEEDHFTKAGEHDALLFEQAGRIDAALAGLQREDSQKPRMYFLGFAGYAHERVFAEEIALAARVVGNRFDVGNRSLQLVNDHRDLEKHALATVPALRHALLGIAKQMDPDEDVLFLTLSSHGGKEGDLSVSVDSELMLFPQDLNASELKKLLDEAGIRWKVIVVSACYSGSFVAPLADDYTIVITASAKDRTSFGCSDERDLTYFGEAFFRDALPGSANLREAFESARKAIEARERGQLFLKASNPQAHFGELAERKLAEFGMAPTEKTAAQGR